MNSDFFRVGNTILVFVAIVFEPEPIFRGVLAEQIGVAILVAGGDELFQLQRLVEVVREVVEEFADLGVVAIARTVLFLKCFL